MSGELDARLEARREGSPVARFPLSRGRPVLIGHGEGADWRLSVEPYLGRRHVEVRLQDGRLAVHRLEGSTNPVFWRGEDSREFHLHPGEHFVIGDTRFVFLAAPAAAAERRPDSVHSITEEELYAPPASSDRMRLRDLMELPGLLSLKRHEEAFAHIAALLRMSLGASWVRIQREAGAVLAADAATDAPADASPSRTLIEEALKSSPRPVIHCWDAGGDALQATASEGVDWAVCAAAPVADEPALVFYAAGRSGAGGSHVEDGRFLGLVADMVGRSLAALRHERRTKRLEQFFSGPVAARILQSEEALTPRAAESTVLFFDLRGFSLKSEESRDLLAQAAQVRAIFTAMTAEIFAEEGVVLQYLGDGILACWNVPLPDPAHVDRACRAALRMAAAVPEGWRCGIGLQTGEVVAGRMGSDQVFFYGLVGRAVNQASRVEQMSKRLGVAVLASGTVAERVSPGVAAPRRLGRFRPAGMGEALEFFELSVPGAAGPAGFSEGLGAFESGDWALARRLWRPLSGTDGAARFLLGFMDGFPGGPPAGWAGVVELSEK